MWHNPTLLPSASEVFKMSERKGAKTAQHYTNLASAFEVTPELIFLMETTPMWNEIVLEVRNISKGSNRRNELLSAVDKVMEKMLGLQVLLKGK